MISSVSVPAQDPPPRPENLYIDRAQSRFQSLSGAHLTYTVLDATSLEPVGGVCRILHPIELEAIAKARAARSEGGVVAPVQEFNQVFDITHTFVDPSLRGTGAAGRLTRAVMELLRAQGDGVVPSCTYTQKWLKENPEFADMVVVKNSQGRGSL